MSHIPQLSKEHKDSTNLYDKRYSKFIPLAALSAVAGSFLLIGALLVIFASSLCLTLPGINVIYHVILPGLLPGVSALVASIPFFVGAFLLQRKMGKIRKDLLQEYENILNGPDYGFNDMSKKEKAVFIGKELLNRNWSQDYRERILTDLKNRLPKESERDDEEKALAKIYDKAKEYIAKKNL